MFGTWTNVELTSMIDAVKWARTQLTKDVKNSIKTGQQGGQCNCHGLEFGNDFDFGSRKQHAH
jgi:hypothetical protein